MGAKKPKKQKQQKVVTRDIKAEQEAAAAAAAQKANLDTAYRRQAKSRMMNMRVSSGGSAKTGGAMPNMQPMTRSKNKKTGA